MGTLLKLAGTWVLAGAACKAGVYLWDNVLQEKACNLVKATKEKINSKKEGS